MPQCARASSTATLSRVRTSLLAPDGARLLNAAIGMVSVVCVIVAWNSGNRTAIRINAAALIINALMVLPGLFAETSAFITVVSAATVVATLVAVVLTMRRERTPVRVVD